MTEPSSASFRQKLVHLLAAVPNADGNPYSFRELAALIRERGYRGPSAGYLNQLATGARRDPKMSHLEAIAAAFGVPASYFFDPEVSSRVDAQLEDLRTEQLRHRAAMSGEIVVMATRASELSDAGRRQVMELLDVVYRLEQHENRQADEPPAPPPEDESVLEETDASTGIDSPLKGRVQQGARKNPHSGRGGARPRPS